VRSVVYRFAALDELGSLIAQGAEDYVLPLPPGEAVGDGEWVLAVFEVGAGHRATAAAARGVPDGIALEPRDLVRVRELLGVRSPVSVPPTRRSTLPPDTARSPAAPASSGPVRFDSGKFPARFGAGARVLLVDDDPGIREVVGTMLEAVGLVVATCGSGEDALARATASDFDLLVVDWNLPGMNGLGLCRALRASARTATIPVLFLSANASSQDMVEAFESGADDYVVKPFRAPELGARIFGLLRRARMVGRGS
jgi:two-component system phosphate regulon response regulator PhoB